VPDSWDIRPQALKIEGDEPANSEYDNLVILWQSRGRGLDYEIVDVPAGRHRLTLLPLGWGIDAVVGPGRTRVDLTLGDPVQIIVHVLDGDTAMPIPTAVVEYGPVNEFLRKDGIEDLPDGGYRVKAGNGTVCISASAPGYARKSTRLEVNSTQSMSIDLSLRRGGTLLVRLECDGRLVSGSPSVMVRAVEDSDPFGGASTDARNGVATFHDLAAGRYEVRTLGTWEGLVTRSQVVEVAPGRRNVVSLTMERRAQ
jgi:hypothetical protein